MNHSKDWDGHRDDGASNERDEKKRVLRQKTLSLEGFFIPEHLQVKRDFTKPIVEVLQKSEKPKNF